MKRIILISIMFMQSVLQAMGEMQMPPRYYEAVTRHLVAAVKRNDIETVRRAIEVKANVNGLGFFQKCPLQIAIDNKAKDIAKLLLANGAAISSVLSAEQIWLLKQAMHHDFVIENFGEDLEELRKELEEEQEKVRFLDDVITELNIERAGLSQLPLASNIIEQHNALKNRQMVPKAPTNRYLEPHEMLNLVIEGANRRLGGQKVSK
ncbi:hypothetical protein KAZ82_00980 [Candidatus Babeliales bacterium]|nr:hypothetical protein [Candidatus Babeliales bacterium]